MANPIKVFISYSHDSDEHREFVLQLSNKLRREGIDSQIDRYINGTPAESWQRWMENQVESADFVLLVCTPLYLKRFKGQDTDAGRGVNFEGIIISQALYDHYYQNTKFLPVIPAGGSIQHVPPALKDFSYLLDNDYEKLYRVLTDQHATPAPELGNIRILSTDDFQADTGELENSPKTTDHTTMQPATAPGIGEITKYSKPEQTTEITTPEYPDNNNNYILWLAFSVEQQNNSIQVEYLGDDSLTITPSPIESILPFQSNNPDRFKTLFKLLFGDIDHCLTCLRQFPETAHIRHPENAKIRMRIMSDDPELALLPWQHMQFPDTGKSLIDSGWMIETGPQLRHYQANFSPLLIQTPLIVIPGDQENNMLVSQHYSLVHDYLNSYLGIKGIIPRITTADQLLREIQYQQPDFIYFYCRIKNGALQLDNSQVSLQDLAEMLESVNNNVKRELYRSPSVILNLVSAENIPYPLPLLKITRLLWLQAIRSQVRAHNLYEQSLLTVLENLQNNHDLAELISHENINSEQQAYLWLNSRSPTLNITSDSTHTQQQLRVALLRVMLGRKTLKGSMNNEISNTTHRDFSNILIYAIAGDEKACPLEFPAQLRQTIQWYDPNPSRNLAVIPFDFYFSISPDQEPYDQIEDILSKSLLQGDADINAIFQKARQRRGLDHQDCCIMINWLITAPDKEPDDIAPLIKAWIKDWCHIIKGFMLGNIPERTVLVNSACIQVEHEDQAQAVHDLANISIRETDFPQLQLISIEKALGKMSITEIADFLQYNQRWRRDLRLDEKHIKPHDYANWIFQKTAGLFETSVQLIWQQYQTNYQDYLEKGANSP